MRIRDIITEKYVNAVGDRQQATDLKQKYKNQVWDILQSSYASIGGIKGSGFERPDDMVQKIPFWKMAIQNGQVKAVILYKDKQGRKTVAIGSDGSEKGKWFVKNMLQSEPKRSYGEYSKGSLGILLKSHSWDVLEKYLIKPRQAAKILSDNTVKPVADIDIGELPKDAQLTLEKYPQLIDYGYIRNIGGEPTFKVMSGTVKPIT